MMQIQVLKAAKADWSESLSVIKLHYENVGHVFSKFKYKFFMNLMNNSWLYCNDKNIHQDNQMSVINDYFLDSSFSLNVRKQWKNVCTFSSVVLFYQKSITPKYSLCLHERQTSIKYSHLTVKFWIFCWKNDWNIYSIIWIVDSFSDKRLIDEQTYFLYILLACFSAKKQTPPPKKNPNLGSRGPCNKQGSLQS